MFLRQTVELKQKQELVMTQQLRQSIELLQYNTLELKEYISKEIMENPILELKEDKDNTKEIDWENYAKKTTPSNKETTYNKDQEYNLESFVEYEENLYEYLLNQLVLTKTSKLEFLVCDYLISNINPKGYLDIDLQEVEDKFKLDKDFILSCLKIVQTFEPIGVGAKDLKECLNIQLDYLEIYEENTRIIVNEYLEEVGKNNLKKISKDLNIDINEVKQSIDIIGKLVPNPGNMFSKSNSETKYITPDAYVLEVDGKLEVIVEDYLTNRLNISNYYKNILINSNDDKTKEYLEERLNRALWVIKSIEQRRQTIIKVINSIIKHQKEFFYTGDNKINPLTLKQIAEDIDMHESTVSRVTSNKYVETSKGLFELKYFFNSKIGGIEDLSSLDIKNTILEIINNENKKKPYSDQAITDMLKNRGVKISRRTIAKYRDELEIPSSTMRKKY